MTAGSRGSSFRYYEKHPSHDPSFRAALTIAAASGVLTGFTVPPHSTAASPRVAQGSAPGKHMLFRVRGSTGATVYLLGSVHLLDPQAGKLPAEVDSAFAHAKTIAFETSLDTVQMRAMELMTRGQYSGGATLRSSLSPAGLAKADSVLKLYGLTIDQVNRFKPWLVSVLDDADGHPEGGVRGAIRRRHATQRARQSRRTNR